MPPWIAGIINLRGDIVAVLDLALLLGLPATPVTPHTRILIALHDGRRAGILVDRVDALRDVDAATLGRPPATLPAPTSDLITAVATDDDGTPVCVIDIAAMLQPDRLRTMTTH